VLAHNKHLNLKPMQSNVSKEAMIWYGLFKGTFKAIWLGSVESCWRRLRETGNMGENSCKEFEDGWPVFVRTGWRRARRMLETLTESTEFELYFATKICN